MNKKIKVVVDTRPLEVMSSRDDCDKLVHLLDKEYTYEESNIFLKAILSIYYNLMTESKEDFAKRLYDYSDSRLTYTYLDGEAYKAYAGFLHAFMQYDNINPEDKEETAICYLLPILFEQDMVRIVFHRTT